MRFWIGLVAATVLAAAPSSSIAQSDPATGYFESEGTCSYCEESPFNWRFGDDWGGMYYYVYRTTPTYVFQQIPYMYITSSAGTAWYPYITADQYNVDYADEGFSTDVIAPPPDDEWQDYPDFEWQSYVYVPSAAGASFARFMFKVTNTGDADDTVTFGFSGTMMYTGAKVDNVEVVDTGDGDDTVERTDGWLVVDDAEGEGQPPVGIVWQAEGADEQADTVTYTSDWGSASFTLTFTNVPLAVGETKTFGMVLLQAETRDQALLDAQDLAELGGSASDLLDVGNVEDSLQNFFPGDPTGPRLRSNGPYVCDEGGSVTLGITVEDRDGEGAVGYSWDFNGDGAYGDLPGTPNPTIDCANADGPSSIRSGIQLVDNEGITEDRAVSVSVRNVLPVITSEPSDEATTGEEYTYQVAVDDHPSDTFTYTFDESPPGMTVSAGGLVRWTPPANGIGPDVPVELVVSDDDGGEVEQNWIISMQGGPTVNPGGPYRVAEGDDVVLSITASDPENPDDPDALTYAWDLDSDGVFDEGDGEPTVTWSAAGIDGPADGFIVRVVVSDGEYDIQADIPVQVTNAPPVFVSTPSPAAVIAREWTYTVQAVDPGDDPFEITVDEEDLPLGATFDPIEATFRWTPNEGHLLQGEPPGHYCWRVSAEDEDNGRSAQEVCVTIGTNNPPPVPPIKYPDGSETVHSAAPTIILDNVDDPDGDPVTYFIEVDHNLCFCSVELAQSGELQEGQLVTQWTLPRPFNVDPDADGHTEFYVRRWSFDGLVESQKELSTYEYEPDGGDADSDGDGDGDDDDDDDDKGAGCACRSGGTSGTADATGFGLAAALLGLFVIRRRR